MARRPIRSKRAPRRVCPQQLIPREELVSTLHRLGHFGDKPIEKLLAVQRRSVIDEAVASYQRFHGLPLTGICDEATAHQLDAPRCGLPDLLPRAADCQWPMKRVLYMLDFAFMLPGLSSAQAAQAYMAAIAQWNAVCGIELSPITDVNQANIYARSGLGRANNLDGRGGILGWSDLPCGATQSTRLAQMFDMAEQWSPDMALGCITHELGHALGLQHSGPGDIMAPVLNPQITSPQPGDIQLVLGLYGPPAPATAPVVPPPVPTSGPAPTPAQVITVTGQLYINGQPFTVVPST